MIDSFQQTLYGKFPYTSIAVALQKLTFEVTMEDGGVLAFALTFDGSSIQGTCTGTGNGGEKMSAKVSLKRVS